MSYIGYAAIYSPFRVSGCLESTMTSPEFPPSLLDTYWVSGVAFVTSARLDLGFRFVRVASLNRKLRALPDWKTYLAEGLVLDLTWEDVVNLPEETPIRALIKRHAYRPIILVAHHAQEKVSLALGKVRTPSTLLYLLQFDNGVKVGIGGKERLYSYNKPWMRPVLREFSVPLESPRALESAVKRNFREYTSGSDEFFVGVHFEDIKKFIVDSVGKVRVMDRKLQKSKA